MSKAIGAFSRVQSTERSRVDLNHAIQCATTMAMTTIKFRAELVVDYGDLPPLWASAGKLSQVFLNLLINAAHAIEPGHVRRNRIEIKTWSYGDVVFAEVKDTGGGISEANLPRIFDPFFTTKAADAGSGLGLTICRNIISEFGGDIEVKSEVGVGTRFTVRLPVRAASSAPPPMPTEPPIGSAHGRVLLVDDEQPLLTMFRRILGADHQLVTALSGEAAQLILEYDQAFDVILCDLMMPGLSGMGLHAWIDTHYPALAERVVFVTGGAFTQAASEYLTRVTNLRVEKPYDVPALTRLVSDLVVKAKSRPLAEEPVRRG
jgi:CheY-like chemotaxis protein/two-component sensor histidine kinase